MGRNNDTVVKGILEARHLWWPENITYRYEVERFLRRFFFFVVVLVLSSR